MITGNPANAEYYLRLYYTRNSSASASNSKYVTKAVVGHYDSLEAALSAEDIKSSLIPASWSAGSGYPANYSGVGQNFTVFADDEVYKITVKAVDSAIVESEAKKPNPGSADTYFRITGATEVTDSYVVPYEHDTYYDVGFQTVLYTADVALSELKPIFWNAPTANVYSGHAGNAGTLQISGTTPQDFSEGPVQYAVPAEDGSSLKNYWVTFVKKNTGGAKLFVNGINGADGAKREVFLTSIHGNAHDIFIANVGDEELTGLKATLTGAQNIKLDPYWTVGGEGNDTLAEFTEVSQSDDYYAELANVAKIRLLPDGEGEIRGTLTIAADGQENVVIELTGNAGNPRLTTGAIPEAVKFVPYSVQILHNNKYSWNTVSLEVYSGTLPNGVTLKPNGELYGVPKETGTFKFAVRMTNSDSRFTDSVAAFMLTVKENTAANVDAEVDSGYAIQVRVPDTMTAYADREFKVEGVLLEFMDFYLDGNKLVSGTDYTAEDGSTKITIKSQTFQTTGTGTHTIAAEFRVDGDTSKEMKKAAQNYTLSISGGGGGGSGGGGSSGGSSSSGSGSSSSSTDVSGDTITKSAAVEGSTATAGVTDTEVTNAISGAGTSGNVTIKVDPKGAATAAVTLSKGALGNIAESNKTLTVTAETLGSVAFDVASLKSIFRNSGAASDSVVISITSAKKSDLTAAQQSLAPDGSIIVKCSVSIAVNVISGFGTGIVTLSVPFTLPNGVKTTQIVPYFLNEISGKLELVMGGYNATSKTVDFKLRHFSDYIVKTNDKQYEGQGGWYDSSLDWAVQRDLLDKFIVDGKINAAQNVSRGDFTTALIKALGIQPLTSFTVEQFADVSGENAAYIQTARELGIVSGVGNNKFDPESTAQRGEQFQIVYNLIQTKLSTVKNQNTSKTIADFNDADAVPEWLKPALSELLTLGVVQGDGTNLKVKDNFTVGEICVVLQKMATPNAAA